MHLTIVIVPTFPYVGTHFGIVSPLEEYSTSTIAFSSNSMQGIASIFSFILIQPGAFKKSTRYPCTYSQHGTTAGTRRPDTSAHDQQWELNPRPYAGTL